MEMSWPFYAFARYCKIINMEIGNPFQNDINKMKSSTSQSLIVFDITLFVFSEENSEDKVLVTNTLMQKFKPKQFTGSNSFKKFQH